MPIHGYPGNIITANPTAPTPTSASGVWTTEQQLQYQNAGVWPPPYYLIQRSLRFNSADSAYLNRTPSGATNQNLWTFSCWLKLGSLGTSISLWSAGNASNSYSDFGFSADRLYWYNTQGGVDRGQIYTASVLRDPSAWYHIVFIFNGTTPSVSFYVNGVLQTTTVTTAQAVASSYQNGAVAHNIGRNAPTASQYFNGYLTEVNFIDGQALTPSSFGETDTNTGVWKPKAYTGTYGTNGFFLKFADNSNTTAATLGKDSSGNGNNWTPNNFSVTAGAGNDSLVDSPTQYGTDTGAGGEVRGNYATLNAAWPSTVNVTDGNLKLSMATNNRGAVGTIAIPIGSKIYFEATITDPSTYDQWVGIIGPTATVTNTRGDWNNTTAYGLTHDNSSSTLNPITAGVLGSSVGTPANGDVFGVAVDRVNNEIKVYQNNNLRTTISISATETYFPACGVGGGTDANTFIVFNFGQRPFAYTAPSGFKALCTQNLPTPTIGATSTTQANDYFNAVLYTGNGSTQSITGVGFQPDFVWNKSRSNAQDHRVFDVLRGTSNALFTNLTLGDYTESGITSFNSDGFTIGSAGNTNGYTYVSWNWKANGAGSSNTAGSITSTVSANTTSGFSIATFTKNATTNETIGHGLGVAPSMVIVKTRQSGGYTGWAVYHTSVGSNGYLELQTTSAFNTLSTTWNNTAPTSTVFTMGTGWTATQNMVAYCFAPVAGYSAFGSYTGNGSADGPFVYTGFRPRWVMVKLTSAAGGSWVILDTSRDPYNAETLALFPNTSDADSSGYLMDGLANGFKIRNSGGGQNTNGATYIYAAFAESPFKYSLAR